MADRLSSITGTRSFRGNHGRAEAGRLTLRGGAMAPNSRRCRRSRTRHRGYQKSPPGVTRFTAGTAGRYGSMQHQYGEAYGCHVHAVAIRDPSPASPWQGILHLRTAGPLASRRRSAADLLGDRHPDDRRRDRRAGVLLRVSGRHQLERTAPRQWRLALGETGLRRHRVQRTVHWRDLHIGWRRARVDISDRQRAARCGGPVRLRDRHALPRRRRGRHGAALRHPVRERPAAGAAACRRWQIAVRYQPLHLAGKLFSGVRIHP